MDQGGGDVAVDREHPAKAHRRDAQGQPHLGPGEHRQFAPRAGARVGGDLRGEQAHQPSCQQSQHRHHQEGRAPAHRLAEAGGQGHADHIGHAQPQHHPPHRLGAFVGRNQRGGDQRGHAEIGPVRQPGQEPRQHHQRIAGRPGAQQVAEREQAHQNDQHDPARGLGQQHGDHRRPDHHPQRIGADHVTHGRDRHLVARRHIGQQSHGGELAGPQRQPSRGQRKFGEPHAMGGDDGRAGSIHGGGGRARC